METYLQLADKYLQGIFCPKRENEFLRIDYLEYNQAPRPGTSVPLSFVDTSEVDDLEDVASEFFEKILDLDYYECFISDESRLTDFGRDDEETLQKINATYGLGLTDLGDGNLVRLFRKIKDSESGHNFGCL